jgi:hypothetical protein
MPVFFESINSYMNIYFGIQLPFHAIIIGIFIFIIFV